MKIGIVGLGLIGGSLGLELRSRSYEVFGVSRQEETCQVALERGIVDRASTELNLLVSMEVIFICTPLGAIAPTVQHLIPFLRPETVLTDVGSVKAPIVESITPLWSNFVGGHPMTGTEKQGIYAAQRDLFASAPYILTPTEATPTEATQKLATIIRSLGSTVYFCSPQDHDRAVAWISHLPVFVSASLIAACGQETDTTVLELAQKLASSGFRDTSRVGGGNPELGVMMGRYNRQALLRSLVQYRQSLDQIIEYIEGENWPALMQILETTQGARSRFL